MPPRPAPRSRRARLPNLDTPDNPGPDRLDALAHASSDADLAAARAAPVNDCQQAMHEAAAHLPPVGLVGEVEDFLQRIEDHIDALVGGHGIKVPDNRTRADGLSFIMGKTRAFLKRCGQRPKRAPT